MSKANRQTSKQKRSASNQNAAKQERPASNGIATQATKQATKQEQPVNKQPVNKQAGSQAAKTIQLAGKAPASAPAKQEAVESRQMSRQAIKYERRREQQRIREEEKQRTIQRKRLTIGGVIAAGILVAGVLGYFIFTGNLHSTTGPAVTPTPTLVNPGYPPVDGISCDTLEHNNVHFHTHLTLYINNQRVTMPAQIGIDPNGSCIYWLHTHNTDGIIHIEVPSGGHYTFGQFLDIWFQHFSSLGYPSQLDQTGWQVYIDGKPYTGDFRSLELQPHMLITMAFNSKNVVPDTTYNWGGL